MVPRFPGSSSSVPHGKVKGTNLHPSAAQFAGPTSDVFVNVWAGGYDWQLIKDSIDLTKTTGVNVFRAIGATNAVTEGYMTRTSYLSRQSDIATYCQSVGVRYYPCGGSLTHRGAASDSAIINEVAALYAAMIPFGDTIFGFDLWNEYRDDAAGLDHAALMVKNCATQIRSTTDASIPMTASINADPLNASLIRAIAPYINYLDFHLYFTLAVLQANLNYFAPLAQIAPGFKVVLGETGISRTGTTAQDRADYYTGILTLQNNTPQMLGTCQWAAINNDFGLFDETTHTLQTDISGAWAQFPNL